MFGYFENLSSQNIAKVLSEKARLWSFNDTLVAVGYERTMVELFAEETMDLFESLRQAMGSSGRGERLLLDVFNDQNRSNSIVFHFKVRTSLLDNKWATSADACQLLTSATMKLNADQYQPLLEQPLSEYCQTYVDAFGQEIEHISLQALRDGVIAPANMNIIVMYLDRSQGDEVTPHHLVANPGPHWPTITLLYRP